MSDAGRLRLRPGPLRAAAGLAAVFVVARVVYRILFDGASGSGAVLLPLPSFRLPPPFGWVTLLGPVTVDGLADAALSALPVAGVILAFGVLNAAVDVSRGFAALARRGPLRGIARALTVAWSTLPALGQAVRTVAAAQRLRGERPGPRLLVPVLERTLERASAVANGLELRGLGGTAASGDPAAPPVHVRDAAIGFTDEPVIRVREFTPRSGTLVVMTGPTGIGKSTLLRGLAGLIDHTDGGWTTGTVDVAGHDRRRMPPRDSSRLVGVVLQNPREGFCSEHVRDEVGLALQLRGVAQALVQKRVHEVAETLRIEQLLDRPMHALSAGEATLVAIAAAVIERPPLLLADEPLADLDTEARERVVGILDLLAHRDGVCVVVAEHRAAAFQTVTDEWWAVDGGELVRGEPREFGEGDAASAGDEAGACGETGDRDGDGKSASGAEAPEAGAPETGAHETGAHDADGHHPAGDARTEALGDAAGPGRTAAPDTPDARGVDGAGARAVAHGLAAAHLRVAHGDIVAVHDASVAVAPGEIAALIGPNGAGKSSLLVALALPPRGSEVRGRAVLVPDASDDLFTRDSVAAECAGADRLARRAGTASAASTSVRFGRLLGLDAAGLADRLRRHPRDLSLGERRCLAIALQLSRSPEALLIDEPTRGLDARARSQVRTALRQVSDAGTAVLLATHDAGFARDLGARVIPMRDGIAPASVPAPAPASTTAAVTASTTAAVTASADASASEVAAPRESFRREDSHPSGVSAPGGGVSSASSRQSVPRDSRRPARWAPLALLAANLVALAAFVWPFAATAVPSQANAAVPWVALAVAPIAAIVAVTALDGAVRSAHVLAYLGVLTAIGTAVRIASTGVGGVEAVFVLLVLAGRAFGPRFGMLLGALTVALSSTVFGGFGPWTPFQMFACAWVGAGAGLLPRRVRGWWEIVMLCGYGAAASYVFGLLLNLWFWPFAVGGGTAISYAPGGPLGQNVGSFLLYSLVTSTAGWDTLRAITTIVGVALIGRPVLAALRRAKPVRVSAPVPAPLPAPTPHLVAEAPPA